MNLIKLKCENCGAKLEVETDNDFIFCYHCGSKIMIDDEATKIKRVESAKLKARKENYEQEMKERKENDKQDWKNFAIYFGLSLLIPIFCIVMAAIFDEEEKTLKANEARLPVSTVSCEEMDYEEVVALLENAGFTNIKIKPVYDIVWGFTPEGRVSSVIIGSDTSFAKGDIYDKDVSILITYHMSKDSVTDDNEDENDIGDLELAIEN